jgi:hypothetical protein
MKLLEANLPEGQKFINGNTLTTHDFTVGGAFTDFVMLASCKEPEWRDKLWALTPARVKKYGEDLKEELAEYLENRPVRGF